ncbi:MAG: rhomboid family intramembrane serine protease [Ruminococcaceae bacterium]|nr:rhomboid family intramembrane serine protease [Oscillospiraceae bacterium]
MSNFSTRINRFFLRHRDKGIQNLMLYIAIGNAIVTVMSMINGGFLLYDLLCFDKARILEGQVWRLVTYVFTQSNGGFLELVFLYFFYMLGRNVEANIGTFKFNLFYLSGVVLMDVFAMLFCPTEAILVEGMLVPAELFTAFYGSMAYFLHLSLVLAFATSYPEAQFMFFFIIPIKAWVMALVYLLLVGIDVFNMCYPVLLFPHCLFPLMGLGNYFLFFGDQLSNLLPLSWRAKLQRRKKSKGPKVVKFQQQTGPYRTAPTKEDYLHKCTVCGRTDKTDPGLEFRYCSRCNGYHCYCIDHINNHTHIE